MLFYGLLAVIVISLALVMTTEIRWIKNGYRKQAMILVIGYTILLAGMWALLNLMIAKG